jgi:hypothetical protein
MPPIPQACQGLASDVAALEAADQALRAQLTNLTGAAAWATLAQLGQGRLALERKRTELQTCIRHNTAAFQANLIVMDLAPPPAASPNRIAHLWEIAPVGPTRRETSTVQANAFSFTGPLPNQLGISIATTGDPDILGPDFRSVAIAATNLPAQGAIRVEVVLGPVLRIEQAEISRWAAVYTQRSHRIDGGSFQADISVMTAEATLATGGIVVRLTGQVESGTFGLSSRSAFSASATVGLVPSAAPGITDLCDLITVQSITVDLPDTFGGMSTLVSLIRPELERILTEHLRAIIRRELSAAITNALVLSALPSDVTLSIRQLSIDPAAITFQPALGTIGTSLSTFTPPAIPPP